MSPLDWSTPQPSPFLQAMQGWGTPAPAAPYATAPMFPSLPSAPAVAPAVSSFFPGNMEGSDWSQGLGTAMQGNVAAPGGLSFLDRLVGTKDAPGVGGLALGAINGIGSAYMGMQQYGMAKKQFEASQKQFQMNYDAQKTLTNSRLEDRQRARVAANPGAYQSVGDYMARNGVR